MTNGIEADETAWDEARPTAAHLSRYRRSYQMSSDQPERFFWLWQEALAHALLLEQQPERSFPEHGNLTALQMAEGARAHSRFYAFLLAEAPAREHAGFRTNVATALANRFSDREPSPYPEATLYSGGFLSNNDARACARWHASPWEDRAAISAGFGDERLKAFANRLALLEAPQTLSPAGWQKGQAWLRDRLTTQADVPWLTLPNALSEVSVLRQTLPAGDAARHSHLDAIERWLSEQNRFFQLAA